MFIMDSVSVYTFFVYAAKNTSLSFPVPISAETIEYSSDLKLSYFGSHSFLSHYLFVPSFLDNKTYDVVGKVNSGFGASKYISLYSRPSYSHSSEAVISHVPLVV